MTFLKDCMGDRTTGEVHFAQTTTRSHVLPKLQGQNSLLAFADQVRKQHPNDLFGSGIAALETEHRSFAGGVGLFLSDKSFAFEVPSEQANGSWISHTDRQIQSVVASLRPMARVVISIGGQTLDDSNTPLTVKQSSQVSKLSCIVYHTIQTTLAALKKQVNSVDTPTADASGQYRAKQGVNRLLGVCNEHVLAPKGMMCSELRRNAKSAAEMPAPVCG